MFTVLMSQLHLVYPCSATPWCGRAACPGSSTKPYCRPGSTTGGLHHARNVTRQRSQCSCASPDCSTTPNEPAGASCTSCLPTSHCPSSHTTQ